LYISRIFVYGTLLSGMSNHKRFCGDALTVVPAVTTGRLYHLPYGFPAMFDTPDGQVVGEVMTFPDIEKTLERLDRLEGYHPGGMSHYLRTLKKAVMTGIDEPISVWAYVYPHQRLMEISRDLKHIENGCWRTFFSVNNLTSCNHNNTSLLTST